MKYILIIFLFIASICNAQVAGNFKEVRLLNYTASDSTTSLGSLVGRIRYDPVTGKFRFWNALTSTWYSFAREGGAFWPLTGQGILSGDVEISSTLAGRVFNIGIGDGFTTEDFAATSLNGTILTLSSAANANTISLSNDITIGNYGAGNTNFVSPNNTLFSGGGNVSIGENLNEVNSFSLNTLGETNVAIGTTVSWVTGGTHSTTSNGAMSFTAPSFGFFNGKATFDPTATDAGLNVGQHAGNPSSPTNGDIWYNSTGGVLNARINGATVPLGPSSLTSTYIGYGSGGNAVTGEAALTYDASANTVFLDDGQIRVQGAHNSTGLLVEDDAGNDILKIQELGGATYTEISGTGGLTANLSGDINLISGGVVGITATTEFNIGAIPNDDTETRLVTVEADGTVEYRSASSITSPLTSTQIGFGNGSNVVTGEAALTYDASTNLVSLSSTSGNTVTSIFGGEIQLDNISGGDDVTLNNNGIQVTGIADYQITNGSGDVSINGVAPLRVTTTFDFPSVAAGNEASTTVAVSGVQDGDVCVITASAAVEAGFGGCKNFRCYVSAVNTLTIAFGNCSSSPSDPSNGTYAIIVFKQ